MTCRGGREASERRSGIGENKRQPEMVQLAAQRRHSNLVTLVMLKENIRVKHK